MSELRPPDSRSDAAAPSSEAAGSPPDGGEEAGAAPPPATAAPPPPPAAPPPGPGETPPPAPPVDLSAPETDEPAVPTERAESPPLSPPPPAPPVEEDLEEPGEPGARKRSWTPVLLVLLLLSVSVGAYFGFRGADDDDGSTASTTSGEFATVNDKEAGFTVSYPENWAELAPASGEQRLLLSAGGQNYFQVKVRPVDPATVDQQIAEALQDVRMVTDPRQFELNGVKTYYFLYYTPITEDSPTEGVHAHYFMINGDVLYTMVFQALPTDQFTALAPTFDQVAESFQVDQPVSAPDPSATSPMTAASPSTTTG